ncbi:MAG: hypothetical protein QXS37_05175 [Candidatus Aenigmatarchaeota archaeon]
MKIRKVLNVFDKLFYKLVVDPFFHLLAWIYIFSRIIFAFILKIAIIVDYIYLAKNGWKWLWTKINGNLGFKDIIHYFQNPIDYFETFCLLSHQYTEWTYWEIKFYMILSIGIPVAYEILLFFIFLCCLFFIGNIEDLRNAV